MTHDHCPACSKQLSPFLREMQECSCGWTRDRVIDPYIRDTLREMQTALDRVPGCEAKGALRIALDGLQRGLGGLDEWGRRADGSRPRDRSAA